LSLYRKAADQGYARAQYILGYKYAKGEGVPKDAVQAVQWIRKAADQGYAEAQYGMGVMYFKGEGVPKDAAQAVQWYRKAADQGHAEARRQLEMNGTRFVQMVQEGGVYKVPVRINNVIDLNFIVDSGAADVSIPRDVVLTLIRTGTITVSDFIGAQTYTLADGSTTSSPTFHIRSLKVGDTVLQDVTGSVADQRGDLLLGQSFLSRFKSVSFNNTTHTLVLE
jgi:predicted aspartyl protease